jgi:hypothetical protein
MSNDAIQGQIVDEDDAPTNVVAIPKFNLNAKVSTSYLYEALNNYSIAPYDPSDPFEAYTARAVALNSIKIQYLQTQLTNVFDMIGTLQSYTYQNAANIEKLFTQTEALRIAYNNAAVAFNNSQTKATQPIWQTILQFQASITQSVGAALAMIIPEVGAAVSLLSAFESALLNANDHRVPEKMLSILDKTFQYAVDNKVVSANETRLAIQKFSSYYTMLELRQGGNTFYVCLSDTKHKVCLKVMSERPYLTVVDETNLPMTNLILSRKLPFLLATLMQRVYTLSKFNVVTSSILRYIWTMIRVGLKNDTQIDG